jgi:CRISPR/Cas system-associated exonuclease Cas4 (RecB family)
MKYNPYSQSKISSYFDCPHKFKLNYIDKIKTGEKNIHLKRGNYSHERLEHWPDESKVDEKTKGDLDEENLNHCEGYLKRFSESELGKKYLETPGENEIKFSWDKKLKPCDYDNKENGLIRGKIDKIIKRSEEVFTVIDWKSGKVPWTPDYSQLELYACYLFLKYPNLKEVDAKFVYLEHENQEVRKKIFRKSLKPLLRKILKKIKTIENQSHFPKNITKLCDYCDFFKSGDCVV